MLCDVGREGILPRDRVLFTPEEREGHYNTRVALQAEGFGNTADPFA